MTTEILWHGHSNFQITTMGVSVLIDPFFHGNTSCMTSWRSGPRPDLVLVTHDHADHVGDTIDICTESGALCCCVVETAQALLDRGLPSACLGAAFNIGGTVEIRGVRITMTPAYHSSASGVPAGYIIRLPNGCTVYHAGDTCLFGDMALIGQIAHPDVALLPIGDYYTMNPLQAAQACALIKPKIAIPMHWGTFPALVQSPDIFAQTAARLAPETEIVCLQPGQVFVC